MILLLFSSKLKIICRVYVMLVNGNRTFCKTFQDIVFRLLTTMVIFEQ